MSIVNINVSVLYSSEGGDGNSHTNCRIQEHQDTQNQFENTGEIADHSMTLTYSPDSKKKTSGSISKNSKNSSSKQSKTSQANQTLNNLITNNLSHTNNSSSNKSKDSENTMTIKNVIAKRKQLVLKQVKQGGAENVSNKYLNTFNKNFSHNNNNLVTNVSDEYYDMGMNQGLQSQNLNNSENLKITNITNIIVGPKSFDIKDINNPRNEKMLRDIKALSLITQKALSSHCKANPIDSIDDERRSFCNFQNKKELYIDDNSDLPSGMGKSTPLRTETSENRIINIININNNYNIGNLNMQSINQGENSFCSNYYSMNSSSQQKSNTNKSFKTMNLKDYKRNFSELIKENLCKVTTPVEVGNSSRNSNSNISNKNVKKLIPRHSNTTSKESFTDSRQSFNKFKSDSLKEIIKSVKKEHKKEKFVALNTLNSLNKK